MEAAQSHRDVEAPLQQGVPELQAQTSGILHVLSSFQATRFLHLEHLPRHGNYCDDCTYILTLTNSMRVATRDQGCR